MSELTVIFPAAAALFVLLLCSEYIRTRSLPCRPHRDFRMHLRDHLLAWAIAGVYALVAFTSLGDTRAVENYCRPESDEGLYFVIPEDETLGRVRWFAGLKTGKWELLQSADGANWERAMELEHNYVAVLKWNESFADAPLPGPYFCLVSSGNIELGELALYSATGERLMPVSCSENAIALFDEAELVPEAHTYLNSSYFDEIYHPRTAWEGLRGMDLYEITHPPLGKLILSLGILLFGMCPFGWRFMGTLFGVLMLPLLYAFLKRLLGRREAAACGTVIFAADFMHFAQTRIATIDTYGVFFTLAMYYFMYRFVDGENEKRPSLMLALSGLCFGLGAASKWTCLYAGAGLALIWLLYWVFRKELFRRTFWKNVGQCLLFFVAVPLLIYYLSYVPYGLARELPFPGMYLRGDYLRLVLDNQAYMFNYHSTLVAEHPYSSSWWQWLVNARPILYYLEYFDDGSKSCIGAFTNPLLCWGGLAAIVGCAAAARRDRRALFILLGYLAQLLPWVLVPRLTFAYHYFPCTVFLTLAAVYCLDSIQDRGGRRWQLYSFTAVCVLLFAAFYPGLSGARIDRELCTRLLQWFPSWPL
ncbi:MAG: glycosyltransferase family 39 protein [Oscillospiraceae bacterium]|nr:glycosyltransferase family 39 protein [Oscillospiraceae bacterium]